MCHCIVICEKLPLGLSFPTSPWCHGDGDNVAGAAGVGPLVLLGGVAEGQLAHCSLADGDAPLQVLVVLPVHGEPDKAVNEDGLTRL